MEKKLKSVLLLGAKSPLTVAFPGRPTHYYYFHIGDMASEEEVRAAIQEADIIYSSLSEEEADVLSWALRMKIPKGDVRAVEQAFNTLGVEEPRKIFLITVHWEMCPLINRVWISSTMGD